jgi:nucleoid-associated protein YgaU
MSELYLKQIIKSIREKSALITFLFGFLIVIFFAFNLLLSNISNQSFEGQITEKAAHSEVDSQNILDKDISVYIVKKGDSSWRIATKLLGDGRKYPEIEELNNLEHDQFLEIGQILLVNIQFADIKMPNIM